MIESEEMHSIKVDLTWQLPLLKLMLFSRASDKREAIQVRQGKAAIHVSSSGHEALIAITYLLEKADYLYGYYRSCHLMMGKGLNREQIASDFLAKATSSSKGRSMGVHCHSRELNIFPGTAPTASQCLPATGTAWGQKISNNKFITVCSIGEGATREGEFYEAVTFAIEHSLPIIFIIEDNGYAISTPTQKMMPLRLAVFNEKIFIKINGTDVFEVYDKAQKAIHKARTGGGPTILWCEVDRLDSHTAGEDHRLYRSEHDLAKLRDPILLFKERLQLTANEFESLEKDAFALAQQAYQRASFEPEPDTLPINDQLYGPLVNHKPLSISLNNIPETMVAAMNQVLDAGLNTYPNMLLFGQDIEDPKGGVFGFTKNLSSKYKDRVINAPIAEATIIGSAVGLAVSGFLPVFEIQFIDFINPGFEQLVTQVASLRWRSASKWKCPLVLYAPYGAYLPSGGLWHSQSNDGWWAHIPGLRVAIPSTPADVLDLFWAAFQDEDPSLILIPKHIFREKHPAVQQTMLAFGKLNVRRIGEDVTVIAWGNTVELALAAAVLAEEQGISVEILDLRTLVPCDWDGIKQSVAKTGRLVVVHEDNKTCGFGASIVSELVSNNFDYFYSSPQLIARNDVHIPFNATLEALVLPSVADIYHAINKVME